MFPPMTGQLLSSKLYDAQSIDRKINNLKNIVTYSSTLHISQHELAAAPSPEVQVETSELVWKLLCFYQVVKPIQF